MIAGDEHYRQSRPLVFCPLKAEYPLVDVSGQNHDIGVIRKGRRRAVTERNKLKVEVGVNG